MVVSWGAEDPGRNLAKLAEAEAVAMALPAADGGPGPDVRLARVQYWIGRIHYYRDEPREAYFQQVLAVGQELGDPGLLAIPLAVMGRALVVQGHFDRAIPVLAGAIGPLEKANEWLDWAFDCVPRRRGHGHRPAEGGHGRNPAGRNPGARDEEPDHPGRLPDRAGLPVLPDQGPGGVPRHGAIRQRDRSGEL